MNASEFWHIIEESRSDFDPTATDGNMERQEQKLSALLESRTAMEIRLFDELFGDQMDRLYRWDLWGVAYVLAGGCSDDAFTDFRRWLISQGRAAYEQVRKDPDSVVDIAFADGVEDVFFEEIGYVASTVYEAKEGSEMPWSSRAEPREPIGERWDESDLPKLFPRCWAQAEDA